MDSLPATCTITSSLGMDCRNAVSARVAATPASGESPIVSRAAGGPVIRKTSARAASNRSRMGLACSSSRAPGSVGVTGLRFSSLVRRSASSAAICCETAAWVYPSSAAARENEPVLTTVTNVRS